MNRPTLAEMKELICCGTVMESELCDYLDAMHDRLRDEVVRALREAVNDKETGGFVPFLGGTELMVTHDGAEERIRAVFDRRKRRQR